VKIVASRQRAGDGSIARLWFSAVLKCTNIAWPAICALCLAGCLSRPALVRAYFSFASPPPQDPSPTGQAQILGIRGLNVDAPFDSQSFIYRTGPFSFERDPYAEFLVPPARDLLAPVCAHFRRNGSFADVVKPDSALRPNALVEITVTQLYGDFRNPGHAAAVLAMHCVFFKAAAADPGTVLLDREFTRSIPLKQSTASAVMAGWNEALQQIVVSACADFHPKSEPVNKTQ